MFVTTVIPALSQKRFDRTVIKVSSPEKYQSLKLDDLQYPQLSTERYDVTCLVYRGTERYYVEISVKNKTHDALSLPLDFVTFNKPGYTIFSH